MKPIASPCINVCTLDASGSICLGCHRTIDEIATWGGMPEAERARVMAMLPARKAQLEGGTGSAQPQVLACARCGASFGCGARDSRKPCWCASYPPVTPTSADASCLCPACLGIAANPSSTNATN
jgi:predicted Fe-S protein YdhL (DUF1289 family)